MAERTRIVIAISAAVLMIGGLVACGIQGEPAASESEFDEDLTPVSSELLRQYEPAGYADFRGVQINEQQVFYRPRKIGDATVIGDYTVYRLETETGAIIEREVKWRDDLPRKLPAVISSSDAAALVEGNVVSMRLAFLPEGSPAFPFRPIPKNPCWIIDVEKDGHVAVEVFDAVEARHVGRGVPPPFNLTAFALTGPIPDCPTTDGHDLFIENARDWFQTLNYNTNANWMPTESIMQSQVSSNWVKPYYHIAHGSSTSFVNRCGDSTTANEISSWIGDKKPFAFLGSCTGMCSTGPGTLSYAFRKGSNYETTTVGYCNMHHDNCRIACWESWQGFSWQDDLFNRMNAGYSVKFAFNIASVVNPGCSAYQCMRFAGDSSYVLPRGNQWCGTEMCGSGQVCCSGTCRTGNCCSSWNCPYPQTCVNYQCTGSQPPSCCSNPDCSCYGDSECSEGYGGECFGGECMCLE